MNNPEGFGSAPRRHAETREDHGLDPIANGQRAALILWTDDVPPAYAQVIALGAKPIKTPETWLERLLIAWVEDPDGHLVQIVQALNSTDV